MPFVQELYDALIETFGEKLDRECIAEILSDQWSEFWQKVEGQIENLTRSISQLKERLTFDREYGIGHSGSGDRINCWNCELSGNIAA